MDASSVAAHRGCLDFALRVKACVQISCADAITSQVHECHQFTVGIHAPVNETGNCRINAMLSCLFGVSGH